MAFKSGEDWKGNKTGRPPREREAAYLLIMKEVVTGGEWKNLCASAYLAARGLRVRYTDGKPDGYENDPLATPGSRLAWTKFLASYLIGMPLQPVIVEQTEDGELLDMLKGMAHTIRMEKDEKLEQFVDEARKLITVDKDLDGKPA